MRILAWLLAGCIAAWAGFRLLGLDRGHPLVALVSFTPHVAAASVPVVLLLFALRQWRAATLALTAALALAALVVPRTFGGSDLEGPQLRVLSVNVTVGQVSAADVIEIVRSREVDILSIQELTPEFDARLRKAGIQRLLPNDVVAPVAGATGTGLYARLPLREIDPPTGGPFAQVAARAAWDPVGEFEVVSVHPPPPVSEQHVAGWHDTLGNLPRGDRPRMLAGDFNATLDHGALRRLLDTGYTDAADATGAGLTATWPADRGLAPGIVIDHVLTTRELEPIRTEVLPVPRGDHRAVYVELVAGR